MNPKGQEKNIHAMNFIEPILCKEQEGSTLSDIGKEKLLLKEYLKSFEIIK